MISILTAHGSSLRRSVAEALERKCKATAGKARRTTHGFCKTKLMSHQLCPYSCVKRTPKAPGAIIRWGTVMIHKDIAITAVSK